MFKSSHFLLKEHLVFPECNIALHLLYYIFSKTVETLENQEMTSAFIITKFYE